MRIRIYFHFPLLLVFLTAGCISRPTIPIPRLEYSNPHAAQNKKLFVFLRGFGGGHKIFEEKGLVQQVLDRELPFDMVAPAAHFGYYKSESLGERLYEDIIQPARQEGCQEVWLVGTSMGGLGALFYLTEYSSSVDGVILLSPFVGWGGIIREIKKAGGLEYWQPGPRTEKDYQRDIWAWIKRTRNDPIMPPIYLGYGDDDLFVNAHVLLARQIREDRVVVINGGHNYRTLRRLWAAFLRKLDGELRE
ncbi:hypothetical protein BVY04_04320 [bacterium M21]|nr:hypothetical protein BVY04_04320 [bacterium M21]